ncbi:MAG: 30S ribosomal protein S6 [Desulfobacterales bacterium]|nr:30S ribosomal protein S6 [Desulfobacterales bacterium]
MRRYETVFIVSSDVSDDERGTLVEKLKDIIVQQKGTFLILDEWGKRKLAYIINKKSDGYYYRFDYCGLGAVVSELERIFKIDDRILKYLTIVIDKNADLEKIKEDINRGEIKKVPSPEGDETVQSIKEEDDDDDDDEIEDDKEEEE